MDDNPYSSPVSPTALDERTNVDRDVDGRFLLRFSIGLVVMAAVNVSPLYFTWKAYGTDGYECVGWPFVFFKRGGYVYGEYFDPLHLLGDIAIAVAAAYVAARALRNGWLALFHKLRTWGTEGAT
jgi:hypothetical protein